LDSIEVELKVLTECLKKKEKALRQIASITENQGFVLTSELKHEEVYSFFMQMNAEKQDFIDRVLQCDQVFENMLQKIGPVLDANPSKYGGQVRTLQDLIRIVVDLDVRIRLSEDNNSQVLHEALAKVQPQPASDKPESIGGGEYGSNKMLEAYRSQSRRH